VAQVLRLAIEPNVQRRLRTIDRHPCVLDEAGRSDGLHRGAVRNDNKQ
jgi:hypothetical protein